MPMPTYWLNFHGPYRCHHSLACCSSGWPIPIERDRATQVEHEVAAHRVRPLHTPWLQPRVDAPDEVAGTLATGGDGSCVFLKADSREPTAGTGRAGGAGRTGESGGCGIYAMRPQSCAHFPYVCLIDQRGVRVTLSHYCPTAASLLFDHDGPVEIVEGPSPVPGLDIPEGLDARDSLPPLASPERLMTLEEFSMWEYEAIQGLGAKGAGSANRARGSVPLFERARSAVPAPLSWPAAPHDIDRAWSVLVEPAWDAFSPVVGRYLAAKLFASWAAYLGDGTAAVEREVEIASAVLRVEAARQCLQAARPLDAPLLKHAIRQSDLLLMHYADREKLNQRVR